MVQTYDESAVALSDYFQGIGPRIRYIDIAIDLLGHRVTNVIEIGCGDGRDASDIITKVDNYYGFDISKGMIKIARKQLPNINFSVSDAVMYNYPENTDIVYSFAALLHMDKQQLSQVFAKVRDCLNPTGIFYISTKYSPQYEERIKNDVHGARIFYHYSDRELIELAGDRFTEVFQERLVIGKSEWLEIAFRKS